MINTCSVCPYLQTWPAPACMRHPKDDPVYAGSVGYIDWVHIHNILCCYPTSRVFSQKFKFRRLGDCKSPNLNPAYYIFRYLSMIALVTEIRKSIFANLSNLNQFAQRQTATLKGKSCVRNSVMATELAAFGSLPLNLK